MENPELFTRMITPLSFEEPVDNAETLRQAAGIVYYFGPDARWMEFVESLSQKE